MGRNAPSDLAFVAAVLASAGSAACERPSPSADAGSAAGFTVRDSGDVEIVENHTPEHPPGQFWTIDAEPEILLGGSESGGVDRDPGGPPSDSAQLIWRVRGLARLQDGRVAVLSQGNQQLFLFEPSGELSRTIGRRGEGPGEFISPEHLQYLPPDTLAVWDYWFAPVSYFDTNGKLLKERSIDLATMMARIPGSNAESQSFPLPGGSFALVLGEEPTSEPSPGTAVRLPMELALVDTSYTTRSLGSWEGMEMVAYLAPGLGLFPFPTFMLDSHIASGGNPPSLYISNGDRNEIHQFSLDGNLVRIIRRATDPVPVTDEGHRRWLATLEARISEWGDVEDEFGMSWEEFAEGLPRRDTYPPVGGLLADGEGYLWVREWSPAEPGMPDQWSVFSPDGRWLGIVRGLPDLFLCHPFMGPCWVDRDFLLAVRRDAVGVESVEGYRIHRGEGAARDLP